MDLILKAALGAAVVVILAALSKTRNYYIAGLVPLFPTFALIAHYIVGKGRSVDDLKATIVFGMWSIIPYFIYLATLYVMVDRMPGGVTGGGGCRVVDCRQRIGLGVGAPDDP
jgi:membrane protein GlpM